MNKTTSKTQHRNKNNSENEREKGRKKEKREKPIKIESNGKTNKKSIHLKLETDRKGKRINTDQAYELVGRIQRWSFKYSCRNHSDQWIP